VCCFTNKAQVNRAGPPDRSRISIQTVRTATSALAKDAGHHYDALASLVSGWGYCVASLR
jgi:hypothetical protein